jgi:hypothetical protein
MNRLIHPYPFLAQIKSSDAHAHSKRGNFKKGRGDVLLSFILVGGAWAFAFYGVLL